MSDDTMSQLAAALNGHFVTDENGEPNAETDTAIETTAPEEQTTVTEPETEAPVVEDSELPKATEETKTDEEVAEDEAGQRYVPEKRFSKVYGKMKESERKATQALQELESIKSKIAQGQQFLEPKTQSKVKPVDKTDLLEIELLKTTLPQFDPNSSEYSQELDSLGATILAANPGITRTEAARRAVATAKSLGARVTEANQEARIVKSQQSDQGITNRVVSRVKTNVDPNNMTLEQMEAHLKATGQW